MSEGFTVIESGDYEQTRQRLMKDPIVIAMAKEINNDSNIIMESFTHDNGTPRFEFMMGANEEYHKRGGVDGGHIGAIAEAILRLI
jgi:hypothetical protein